MEWYALFSTSLQVTLHAACLQTIGLLAMLRPQIVAGMSHQPSVVTCLSWIFLIGTVGTLKRHTGIRWPSAALWLLSTLWLLLACLVCMFQAVQHHPGPNDAAPVSLKLCQHTGYRSRTDHKQFAAAAAQQPQKLLLTLTQGRLRPVLQLLLHCAVS